MTSPDLRGLPAPWLIAVVHLPALPSAPGASLSVPQIRARAIEDARVLADAGFTAVMVENFGDAPFRRGRVDAETVAALAVVTAGVVEALDVPVGVNVLRNDGLSALAICAASGASFLRVNVLAGVTVTDQGLVEPDADELLRRRAALGADVAILADVDVKHATSLDTRPLTVRAHDLVARSGADAVLVTGEATGRPVDPTELADVAEAAGAPVLAASGTDAGTIGRVLGKAHGVVVGSTLKDPETGRVDAERAREYVAAARD